MVYPQLFISADCSENKIRSCDQGYLAIQRRAQGSKVGDELGYAYKINLTDSLMQQLPLSTQTRNLTNPSCDDDSLLQINHQQHLKYFEDSIMKSHTSNLLGIQRKRLESLSESAQRGGIELLNDQNGESAVRNSAFFHRLRHCPVTQLDSNLVSSNTQNPIQYPRIPHIGSSLLELTRAEAILAANQLSLIANENCRVMSLAGTNSNRYGVNTPLVTAHENQWNKNRLVHALGSDHASRVAMDIIQFQEYRNLSIVNRKDNILSIPHSIPPINPEVPDLKTLLSNSNHQDSDNSNTYMKSKQRVRSFPVKLMTALLQSPDEDIIAWLSDGKSFVVVNPNDFVNTILRRTFKECKYASFVRKLHRWGFIRLTSGNGTDCFHHPLFQKHKPELCSKMTSTARDQLKGSTNGKTAAKTMSTDKRTPLSSIDKVVQEYSRRSSVNLADDPEST